MIPNGEDTFNKLAHNWWAVVENQTMCFFIMPAYNGFDIRDKGDVNGHFLTNW